MTHPQEGLDAWTEQVHAYRIPRYDELPMSCCCPRRFCLR